MRRANRSGFDPQGRRDFLAVNLLEYLAKENRRRNSVTTRLAAIFCTVWTVRNVPPGGLDLYRLDGTFLENIPVKMYLSKGVQIIKEGCYCCTHKDRYMPEAL